MLTLLRTLNLAFVFSCHGAPHLIHFLDSETSLIWPPLDHGEVGWIREPGGVSREANFDTWVTLGPNSMAGLHGVTD